MSRFATVVGAVLAVLALAGCDENRRAISTDDLPAPPEPVVEFVVSESGFDPSDPQTLEPGDAITVTVAGEPVAVISEELPLDTGELFDGETTLVVFDEPGTYELRVRDGDAAVTLVVAGD